MNDRKQQIISMRLEGFTYQQIGIQMGISRQRVEQIASPPPEIARLVRERADDRCESCGLLVGTHGHIHHEAKEEDTYEDVNALLLLCVSCHRMAHPENTRKPKAPREPRIRVYRIPKITVVIAYRIPDELAEKALERAKKAGCDTLNEYAKQRFILDITRSHKANRKGGK